MVCGGISVVVVAVLVIVAVIKMKDSNGCELTTNLSPFFANTTYNFDRLMESKIASYC